MRRERITITLKSDIIKQLDTIIDGKKIRNRSNAIETIIIERFKDHLLQKAILVGSTYDITINGKRIPKILLPLGRQTLIERNIKALRSVGIRDIVIATGEWKSEIEQALGNGERYGVSIRYYEKEDGTGGILDDLQKESIGTFLMANNDILLETVDIGDMYQFHKKNGGLGTIAVTAVEDATMLGSIFMKGNLVTSFREKMKDKDMQSHLINAGVYIFEPDTCQLGTKKYSMLEQDVFPTLAEKKKLYGYQIGKNWVHLHDEERYRQYMNAHKK
jgi:mannose-1-phosphate guanylyltransferase